MAGETLLLHSSRLVCLTVGHPFHPHSHAYDVIQIQRAPDTPFNCHINFLMLGKWEGNVMLQSLYRERLRTKLTAAGFSSGSTCG